MKTTLLALIGLLAGFTPIQSQAQSFTYFESSDLTSGGGGRRGTITLTQPGRLILQGSASGEVIAPLSGPETDIEVDIILRDSANNNVPLADEGYMPGGVKQGTNVGGSSARFTIYAAFHALAENLPAGTYTFTINITEDASVKYVLVTLPEEPPAGLQETASQIIADYIAANDALRAELLALLDQIQNTLQGQIAGLEFDIAELETRIAALEGNSPTQDPEIAVLQSQIDALEAEQEALRTELITLINQVQNTLQNQIDGLDATIADLNSIIAALEARIAALENSPPTQDPAIPGLQSQISAQQQELENLAASRDTLQSRMTSLEQQLAFASTGGNVTVVQSKKQKLTTNDYLIMGGSAAGATGIGLGIYSILDGDPEGSSDPVPSENENRPGYHE